MHPNPPQDTRPFCYCHRLRRAGRICESIHPPPQLLDNNGWLARCNHPRCNETLYIQDGMRTLPYGYKFKLGS